MKTLLCFVAMVFTLVVDGLPAQAAHYPEKPVTCVVPFAPGGAADISVRMLVEPLQKEFGQPIVIVNKGGGSGIPGLHSVLRAEPDGYTVAGGALGNAFVATFFLDAPRFDLDKIGFVGAYMPQERILLAKKDKPYKKWEEFVTYAKANPGKISVGSGASQEALEVVRSAAIRDGLNLKYVMYKSGGEATADLLGGHIDVCELGVGTPGYQAARKGDLVILTNLGSDRIPFFENIPSLKDRGYPYATALSYGFAFPDKTPEAIRAKWEKALEKVLQDKELREKMENAGFRPKFMDSGAYKKFSQDTVQSIDSMLQYNKQGAK